MLKQATRPIISTPTEIDGLVRRVKDTLQADEVWLFGSRARGDHREDSDWDLLAVLPDDSPEELTSPLAAWNITRDHPWPITLLSTSRSELESIWGLPNTLGYDLAREGLRLRVD